ncbi:MAG: hypothetical protein K8U57_14175 [Planctomycetes bacterium]|nr:hypothetical protein [Planctomycetota bacterium]
MIDLKMPEGTDYEAKFTVVRNSGKPPVAQLDMKFTVPNDQNPEAAVRAARDFTHGKFKSEGFIIGDQDYKVDPTDSTGTTMTACIMSRAVDTVAPAIV